MNAGTAVPLALGVLAALAGGLALFLRGRSSRPDMRAPAREAAGALVKHAEAAAQAKTDAAELAATERVDEAQEVAHAKSSSGGGLVAYWRERFGRRDR